MENKIIKIGLILPDALPVPAVKGGAIETLVSNIIKYNKKSEKVHLTVFSIYSTVAEAEFEKGHYENVNVHWTHLNSFYYQSIYFITRALRKTLKVDFVVSPHYMQIEKVLNRDDFDLVIAEGGDYKAISRIAKKYSPDRLALHLHHHYTPSDPRVLNSFGHVIGVSQFVTDEYDKQNLCSHLKRHTLLNCIDIEKFSSRLSSKQKSELRAQLGFSDNDFVVLFVGRIIPEKGIKELVEAIIQISDPKIKLLIIGSANFGLPSKTDFEMKIAKLIEGKDFIKHIGFIPNDEIYKYQNIADLQCVPSICQEAAGLTVLEAQAMGIPLVITNTGGMAEYVDKNNICIVDKNDLKKDLIEAIKYLYSNPDKRYEMSVHGKKNVEQFNLAAYYTNFVKLIKSILK